MRIPDKEPEKNLLLRSATPWELVRMFSQAFHCEIDPNTVGKTPISSNEALQELRDRQITSPEVAELVLIGINDFETSLIMLGCEDDLSNEVRARIEAIKVSLSRIPICN
ncbi:MAG: hypothetical protein ACOX6V_00945 [Patescibacteria group bacterium]|jgi:hypothetical protein